jgi:hypothetical protein
VIDHQNADAEPLGCGEPQAKDRRPAIHEAFGSRTVKNQVLRRRQSSQNRRERGGKEPIGDNDFFRLFLAEEAPERGFRKRGKSGLVGKQTSE